MQHLMMEYSSTKLVNAWPASKKEKKIGPGFHILTECMPLMMQRPPTRIPLLKFPSLTNITVLKTKPLSHATLGEVKIQMIARAQPP